MNLKKLFVTIFLLGLMVFPVFAAPNTNGCTISVENLERFEAEGLNCVADCTYSSENDCGTCCLLNTVYNIVDWAFLIIMGASVLVILWSAFLFLKEGGQDPEKVDKIKQRILYAAIGIIVALLSKALPSVVLSIAS